MLFRSANNLAAYGINGIRWIDLDRKTDSGAGASDSITCIDRCYGDRSSQSRSAVIDSREGRDVASARGRETDRRSIISPVVSNRSTRCTTRKVDRSSQLSITNI